MYSYRKPSLFTWTGTLRECSSSSAAARSRASMTTPSSSGLEVLLNTLQNAGDLESTLNILNVLDELLSAGTDRRIHYMISKGGSEALLMALVNTASSYSPNYTLLLPILHLLAKVGHRDRRIGVKAEKVDAVLVILRLLRHNVKNSRRAAACLWVIRVFCSSVSTATLLGQNRALDVVFDLIAPPTATHTHTIKAAIDAFAALLSSKENCRTAAGKGYIAGLLKLYEDWHTHDSEHEHLQIRRAFLHCLHKATKICLGRTALVTDGGIDLLYTTVQSCLLSKAAESLVEPSVQLMRKCYPKIPLPLTSDHSAYSFPLPGRPLGVWEDDPGVYDGSFEDDSDEEQENEESDCRDFEDDLESDVGSLTARPEPDRPLEQLQQYTHLFPELQHDFQDLESDSEPEESSDEELLNGDSEEKTKSCRRSTENSRVSPSCSYPETLTSNGKNPDQDGRRCLNARDFRSFSCPQTPEDGSGSMVEKLLEKYGSFIPHHDPRLYIAAAAQTKSVTDYSILAFPDFWGHLPPLGPEPMANRKPHVQRKKVFEDVQRLLCPEDIINRVVFDMEDTSVQCSSDVPTDSLRFFSKFESGNLRKAIHIRRYEYDLILNADVNSSSHHQWFYFEVSGMVANVPYRFNVINCEKSNSQFNYGMQPVLYSVREALEGRPHWVRAGTEICYYRNHFCPNRGQRAPSFYTLTFTVTFRHEEDVCYLAYHYPYTFSALQSHLKDLERSVDPRKVFFRQQTLCNTLAGNSCPLITITACPPSRAWRNLHQLRNRPYVVLTARVHPGESNASWVMRGSLEFLCSNDPVAESLREAFILKIVPMLNPDGVIHGNHRCSLSADDLNRQWLKPNPSLSPTIYHTKGLLYYLNSIGRKPLVFCDYHGHSRKKNVFLYGCSVKETLWQSGSPVNTASLKEDPGYRTIAKTLDRIAPAFSFNSCNFLVEKSRASTARVVVWREMGVLRSYTMESTYNGCDQGIYKGLQTGTRELEEMGQNFCQSLLTLRKNAISYNSRLVSHAAAILDLDNSLLDHKSHNCFEDDEPPCAESIEYSCYSEPQRAEELDAEVNGNTSSTEEEGEEEEEEEEVKEELRNGRRRSQRKSSVLSHMCRQDSLETLSMKSSACNGINISNTYLS
ncbi:cytosolic carboxypeptidase 4 isoform X2 [Astyanax mexicanus]|uniref:cytosolic carboxypeptidase 4 isoform X2 n=1 Tax=Astyanax mexicanus TaxID=7994 RepID=UPI0020CAD8D4|nr:cytosolic carboxypeptidase 4 isoform X2 [Astyanax mexicanus]